MPLSPSIIISLASSAVAPMRLTYLLFFIHCLTVSAPVLVFPKPRPAKINHIKNGCAGSICFSRAQKLQSYWRWRASASDKLAKNLALFVGGCDVSQLALYRLSRITHLNRSCVGTGNLPPLDVPAPLADGLKCKNNCCNIPVLNLLK